jgi:hypothetical protein
MANFDEWIQPGKRRYSRIYGYGNPPITYQNLYNDTGNWTGGQIGVGIQAGTNRSISAPVLSSWVGHPVTAQEMQALSVETAKAIYKDKFWNAISADQILSQVIAEFAADMKSSTGNNKALQRALNDIGYNVSIDGSIGQQTLGAINQAYTAGKTAQLYNAHRARMIEHYSGVPNFATALINQLNDDYPARTSDDPIFIGGGTGGVSGGVLIALGIAALLWLKYKR